MISTHNIAKEWDDVRTAFATSIMVDTAISSLAQNLDGPDWPIQGTAETPAAYIDCSYEEAVEMLALKGQPPQLLEQLVAILKDTLAFDDPFGEMVAQSEAASEKDNPLLKNLAKLDIPAEFPIGLAHLSRETLEFCSLEKLTTLGEFAVFAQGMAQSVIVGGDFRSLLNALSHVDERAIATFLPFRPGSRGLHLVEAVGLAVRALGPTETRALASTNQPVPPALKERVHKLIHYFAAEASVLRARLTGDVSLAGIVSVLGSTELEQAVVRLLEPHLAPPRAEPPRKRSWWARLLGR